MAVLCVTAFVQASMLVSMCPYSTCMAMRLFNFDNNAHNDSNVTAAAT